MLNSVIEQIAARNLTCILAVSYNAQTMEKYDDVVRVLKSIINQLCENKL